MLLLLTEQSQIWGGYISHNLRFIFIMMTRKSVSFRDSHSLLADENLTHEVKHTIHWFDKTKPEKNGIKLSYLHNVKQIQIEVN